MNKKIKFMFYALITSLIPVTVFAEDYSYRGKETNVVYIIGMALLIIRIVVPVLLIITGMIGLVQAMTQNNDAEISKELKKQLPKVIIAIIIFILPSIVALIMKLTGSNSIWSQYSNCISKPSSCDITLWEEPPEIHHTEGYDKVTEYEGGSATGITAANSDADEIVSYAMQFKGKDVSTDCSGFVIKVLRKFNHIDDKMASTSKECMNMNRRSNGMYSLYKERGRVVWQRSGSAKTLQDAMKEFPGNCKKGDLIFYTYGAGSDSNDCVQHVALYTGYENGKPMILDSNTQDHVVRYRSVDSVWWAAIPLGCARPE